MDFTFTFAAKTPVDIVDSTYTLLSDINGLSVSKLSLPPKASSALLVQLDKQVIRSTQNFVTEHNVCPASHITSLAVPDHVSSGAPAATAAGDRAGGYPSQISHLTPPTGANAIPGITPAESVLLGLSFLEAIQVSCWTRCGRNIPSGRCCAAVDASCVLEWIVVIIAYRVHCIIYSCIRSVNALQEA